MESTSSAPQRKEWLTMSKFYPIKIIPVQDKVIYIPRELSFKTIHTIAFGNLSVNGEAKPHQTNKKVIEISSSLATELHMPQLPLKLHLFEKEGTLFIGPILGIFTAGFTKYPHIPLGSRTSYFERILSYGDRTGVLPIVFGIQHIKWEQGLVTGYVFSENKWKTIEVPIPNVIYDRLPNRTIENLKMIQDMKLKLSEEYVIPWFNPGFFNKWDIYVKLIKSKKLQPLLPKTLLLSGPASIESMIEQFPFIYLKPIHGSLGNGIYNITKYKQHYYLRFRDRKKGTRLIKFHSLKTLMKFLNVDSLCHKYIVQQGISLNKKENRVIDYRIHTNKKQNGEWVVTAIACKTSASGSPTTHIVAGGKVQTLDETFPDEKQRKTYTRRLSEAAVAISKELTKHWGEKLAEIGFDMGIDQDGNIWMLEANAKPGRSIFSHPKLRKKERYTHKLILEYAVHLTETVINKPEMIFHELVLQ
jgi:YheC/D like ATP-grasp